MGTEGKVLTTAEAARFLRYASTSAVRNLVQRGHLTPSGRRPNEGSCGGSCD